jgi:hypothetical protein
MKVRKRLISKSR